MPGVTTVGTEVHLVPQGLCPVVAMPGEVQGTSTCPPSPVKARDEEEITSTHPDHARPAAPLGAWALLCGEKEGHWLHPVLSSSPRGDLSPPSSPVSFLLLWSHLLGLVAAPGLVEPQPAVLAHRRQLPPIGAPGQAEDLGDGGCPHQGAVPQPLAGPGDLVAGRVHPLGVPWAPLLPDGISAA